MKNSFHFKNPVNGARFYDFLKALSFALNFDYDENGATVTIIGASPAESITIDQLASLVGGSK